MRDLNSPPVRVTLDGFHFLRRRAEDRVEALHSLQRDARSARDPFARVRAEKSLRYMGARVYDRFEIVKSGKFDRRYRVVAIRLADR